MKAVQEVLSEFSLAKSPYFIGLKEGTFNRADFIETQVQFYFAVVFFSRPMAVLAARIPSPELRVEVLRNVWEEHGEGDSHAFHAETFRTLLERLENIGPDDIASRVLWPEVRAFNTALSGCSLLDDWEVAAACFAMIERMFVNASAWIAEAIVAHGWLKQSEMIHYELHETLDVKHAEDFLQVIHAGTDSSPRTEYLIRQGLRLGACLFRGLYDGLHAGRARRERKVGLDTVQPHIYRA